MKTFLLLVLLAPHISAASQRQNQNSSFVYALAKSFLWQRTIPVIPHDLILSTPVPTNVNYSNVVRGRDCNPCANTCLKWGDLCCKGESHFCPQGSLCGNGNYCKRICNKDTEDECDNSCIPRGNFCCIDNRPDGSTQSRRSCPKGWVCSTEHDNKCEAESVSTINTIKSIVIGGLAFCIIVSSLYCLCYGKLKMRNAAPSTSIPTAGIIPPVPTDPKSPTVGNPHPYPPPMFESTTIDSIQNTARIPASGHDLENPLLAKQTSKVPSHEAKRDSEDATGESELIINVTSTSEAKMK